MRSRTGGENARARRCSLPVSNDVENMKRLVVGRVSARRNGDSRNERQETFVHTVAGADKVPAHHRPSPELHNVETKSLVIGQGIADEAGIKKDERPEMPVRSVAGARVAPASHDKKRENLVVGRGMARNSGVERKERPGTAARAVASAENALARYCAPPTRRLAVGQVFARGTEDRKNERQETFVPVVAGANGAPARRRSPRTSKNTEEIYSSTKNVSKRRAALSTLPTVTQASYLPSSQVRTSSKTRQYPS
jgi:hypothetical protein